MSEREDLDTDLTSYSLDDEDQLQPGDSLMGSGTADEDPLDAGYSPPDSARGSYAHGVTAAEQREGESIDQRLKQEEPDTTWEVDEPGRIGGDDPDAIAAEDDWIGDSEVGDARAGRLVTCSSPVVHPRFGHGVAHGLMSVRTRGDDGHHGMCGCSSVGRAQPCQG